MFEIVTYHQTGLRETCCISKVSSCILIESHTWGRGNTMKSLVCQSSVQSSTSTPLHTPPDIRRYSKSRYAWTRASSQIELLCVCQSINQPLNSVLNASRSVTNSVVLQRSIDTIWKRSCRSRSYQSSLCHDRSFHHDE